MGDRAGICSIVGTAAVPYARARAESVVSLPAGHRRVAHRPHYHRHGHGGSHEPWCTQWVFAAGLTWVAFASFVTVCPAYLVSPPAIDEGNAVVFHPCRLLSPSLSPPLRVVMHLGGHRHIMTRRGAP